MDAMTMALRHQQSGRLDEAQTIYRELLRAAPHFAPAMHFLGLSYSESGQKKEGVALMRQALDLAPDVAEFHSNLAGVLAESGLLDEAIAGFEQAVQLLPSLFDAWHNLGVLLGRKQRWREASTAFAAAVSLRPECADVHHQLGDALREIGRLDEAMKAYQDALRLAPDDADMCKKLGATLSDIGDLEGAIATFRRLVGLCPDSPSAHSDLLFLLQHDPHISPEELFVEHKEWAQKHAEHLYPNTPPPVHVAQGRRLRIGYVSADFRDHTVPRFIGPVLQHHDRSNFEIHCYSDVARPDSVTHRLASHVEHWRPIHGMPDEDVAALIRREEIDVLVDLAGHMGDNRMPLFARKPAPVQVSYLGYPGSTGLATMDWRITDRWQDPPGLTEYLYTEKLWRMNRLAWCYDPGQEARQIEVAPLPALKNGYVTFGALNRPNKTTAAMVALWSKVLQALPYSRMILLGEPGNSRSNRINQAFAENGIASDRVKSIPRLPRYQYLKVFSERIDVALDMHPYCGHTTTCDGLWMGVPTISLVGKTPASKVGAAIMTAVQLDFFANDSDKDFVTCVLSLATQIDYLSNLRRDLRGTVLNSDLSRHVDYVRYLQETYYAMLRDKL